MTAVCFLKMERKKKEKLEVLFIGTNQKVVLVADNIFFCFSLSLEIYVLCVRRHHLMTTFLLFRIDLRHGQVLSPGYYQLGMSWFLLFHFVNHCNFIFFLKLLPWTQCLSWHQSCTTSPNACSEPCRSWLKHPVLSKLLHLLYVGVVIKLTGDSTNPDARHQSAASHTAPFASLSVLTSTSNLCSTGVPKLLGSRGTTLTFSM